MLELYEECLRLIARGDEPRIEFDAGGIIQSCKAINRDPDCVDGCDRGFNIRSRGFGKFKLW